MLTVSGRHTRHRRLDDATARGKKSFGHLLAGRRQPGMSATTIVSCDAFHQTGGLQPVAQLYRTRSGQPHRGG